MFHMSREIYDKIEELGRLIQESPEYTAMKQAEEAGKKDPILGKCLVEYEEKKQKLLAASLEDAPDQALLDALTRDLEEISAQMNDLPAYQAMRQARQPFTQLMQGAMDVLQSVVEPDVQCSCRGNCASCPGCGQ